MTFILHEDEALRDRLVGMVVSDDKEANRSVGVWFGQPDSEIRQQSFPFLTINLIDVGEARERVMNAEGVSPWYYTPDLLSQNGHTFDAWSMPMPIPVNLTYQVTSFARQPRHDRQLLAQILGNRLPLRFGSLTVKEKEIAPDEWDATVRRLDMIDIAKRDTVENGKRMFMNSFTVRVSSEIPSPYVWSLYNTVKSITATTGAYGPGRDINSPPLYEETFTIHL